VSLLESARPGELEYGLPYDDFLQVATPAAGANASLVVDGAWELQVVAATASLTTDANAANRVFSLDFIQTRSLVAIRNGSSRVIVANTTGLVHHWQRNRTVTDQAANTPVWVPLLDYWLPPGWTVQFTLDNKQATDQISALALFVRKRKSGGRGHPVGVFTE
jgi:hypothetical protein